MPANAILKSIALGGGGGEEWTPLAAAPTVAQVTLIADPKNTGTIQLRFDKRSAADWPPGAAVPLESVDLAEIEVKGPIGHALLIAGYSPGSDPHGRASKTSMPRILYPTQAWDASGGGGIEETGGEIPGTGG